MFLDEGSCLFSVDRVVVQHGQRTDVLITQVKVSPKRAINPRHLLLINITVDQTSYKQEHI